MMAMTTRSSMSVKARRPRYEGWFGMAVVGLFVSVGRLGAERVLSGVSRVPLGVGGGVIRGDDELEYSLVFALIQGGGRVCGGVRLPHGKSRKWC